MGPKTKIFDHESFCNMDIVYHTYRQKNRAQSIQTRHFLVMPMQVLCQARIVPRLGKTSLFMYNEEKGCPMKIITDTGSLLSVERAKELDIALIPLQVEVNGVNYRDYLDITSERFYELTKTHKSNTSLPSIGQVMEVYEKYKDGIHICVQKGLSSTYDVAAAALRELGSDIILYNSKALVGTQQYLVLLAKRLSEAHSTTEIIARMDKCLSECQSFLIPVDFNFLKRSGRISPMAATFAGMFGIKPILTIKPGMDKLDKFGVGRTWPQAFDQIINKMTDNAVSIKHKIYIVHAMNQEIAKQLEERVREKFGKLDIEYISFSPVMMALGGPGCVALQYILKDDDA